MILRKPYAFLIRHFKLIHLILVVLLGTNFYYSLNINSFFNAYIANGYKATSTYNLIGIYTPTIFLLSIVFAIALPLVLYILLEYKKKPNKFYMLMIIYNVILMALYFFMYSTFDKLSTELLTATTSRIIRDVSIIYTLPMIIFIIVTFVRSIGFNLKSFAFESDYKDMASDFKDSEEVEIGLNLDSYKVKRKLRKSLREFKYYIVENKFVVILILVIVLSITGYTIFTTVRPSYESYYTMGKPFLYDIYEITIEDAVLTNTDYKGQVINPDKEYLVLKVKVQNLLSTSNYFDVNIIKLKTKEGIISIKPTYTSYFSDFSKSDSNYILGKEIAEYVACYELDKDDIENNYQAVISNGTAFYHGETYNKSIFIRVSPTKANNITDKSYNIKDSINFTEEFLNNNQLLIEKYTITKSVKYKYEVCNGNVCNNYINLVTVSALNNHQNNYLLHISGTYTNNNGSVKYDSFNKIINTFGYLEYTSDGENKNASFTNVTPDNYSEGVILEVPGELYNASSINFIIGTRYNKYIIKLK